MINFILSRRFLFLGIMLIISCTLLGCGGSEDLSLSHCPNGTTTNQLRESEPNNQADIANDLAFWVPEDTCTKLQIMGDLRSNGSALGGPNGDAFDLYSFILSTEGTYDFELSELTTFNLDLEIFTRESFSGNRIPGVNYFNSSIDAPSEGNIEFFSAALKPGVEYFIQVRAYDTDDFLFNYTVFMEKAE
jgi:hypothetical protein